jgi:D-aspartate ligase
VSARALGLVMGDVDVVRALGIAGVAVAFFGYPGDPARFSRHVRATLPWIDHWEHRDELLAALLAFAGSQPVPPVLFPQTDPSLLLVSRHRDELRPGFRFALADADLVEDLADKSRFQALAERHELPVPRARTLHPAPGQPAPDLDLAFPLVIKPMVRSERWVSIAGAGKALHVAGADDLATTWARLVELDADLLAQELVAGPESDIESYHVYVDEDGAIAGEFTGRKIRTYPPRYGHSTAVEVTPIRDVAELGREVIERLRLRGVAKADFKRDDRGRLHLLEINPRFNLWHYPGAVAGVNIPALVYADLTGRPRPRVAPVTATVTWSKPLQDLRAAYVVGERPLSWLRWARHCQTLSGLAWDDPLPFVRGALWPQLQRRLQRLVRR